MAAIFPFPVKYGKTDIRFRHSERLMPPVLESRTVTAVLSVI